MPFLAADAGALIRHAHAVGETAREQARVVVAVEVEDVQMLAVRGRHRARLIRERTLDLRGEILVIDAAIVVEDDDRLARIGIVPGNIEAEGPAGAVAAREVLVERAQHLAAMAPIVDLEARMI